MNIIQSLDSVRVSKTRRVVMGRAYKSIENDKFIIPYFYHPRYGYKIKCCVLTKGKRFSSVEKKYFTHSFLLDVIKWG